VQDISENQENLALILESPEFQTFVTSLLLEESNGILEPKIKFEEGISYPRASKILSKKNDQQINLFLRRLSNVGLLERNIVDKLIACPSCRNTRIYTKYQCDKCKSINVTVVEILEHRLCGYMGARSSFSVDSQNQSTLVCPKCKQQLRTENDYRNLGKTFECSSCKSRFEITPIVHDCKKCGNRFTYKEAEYESVFEYRASPKLKGIFSSGSFSMNAIVQWLKDRGFRVEAPKEVTGTSREKHRFDIVASAGVMENLLLGDFVSPVDNKAVITAFAKRYDVNQNAKSFLVTYERAPEAIEVLARTYGISIIVIDPQKPGSLNDQLSRMVGGTPQVIPLSSPIVARAQSESRRTDRKFSQNSHPSLKSAINERLPVVKELPKEVVRRGRQRKTGTSKSKRAPKRIEPFSTKGKKETSRDYYLENDFGNENGDDIFLTTIEETD
jgi:uncharacterized protein YbaR (Trm112 family)